MARPKAKAPRKNPSPRLNAEEEAHIKAAAETYRQPPMNSESDWPDSERAPLGIFTGYVAHGPPIEASGCTTVWATADEPNVPVIVVPVGDAFEDSVHAVTDAARGYILSGDTETVVRKVLRALVEVAVNKVVAR